MDLAGQETGSPVLEGTCALANRSLHDDHIDLAESASPVTPSGSGGTWGPLAVVPPQDGADTARTEGTLRITDTCVFLDGPGGPVLLVWPADRTSWYAQCTLLYTSEGTRIMRYDICDNTALPDVTNLLTTAYALRILPEPRSGILVADTATIKLVDANGGAIIETYDAPGQDCWFALNLDPDGTSFWSADFCKSMVYRFRIADGSVITSFSAGTPSGTVFGLVVNGEFSDARNRTCASEDLSRGQAGNVGDQVVVHYDPRFLVDESKATYTTQAQQMAEQIRSRAIATLTEYRDQLGFSIPDHVTIEIRCEIRPLDLLPPIDAGGSPSRRTSSSSARTTFAGGCSMHRVTTRTRPGKRSSTTSCSTRSRSRRGSSSSRS